jgi:hypothetical protein
MTPLFPGWHLPTLRKKPKTALQKIIENNKLIQRQSITHLNVLLSQYIPRNIFKNISQNAFTRQRIFSLENTFWEFFFQILNPDGGCQSVVNQLRTKPFKKMESHRPNQHPLIAKLERKYQPNYFEVSLIPFHYRQQR